jgi:hypothetical protein
MEGKWEQVPMRREGKRT